MAQQGPDQGFVDGTPDEDGWVVPAAWLAEIQLRRGGAAGRPVERDPRAGTVIQREMSKIHEALEGVLDHPHSDPAMVEAARTQLKGEPNPLGAAVLAMLFLVIAESSGKQVGRLVDAWVAEHGLVFAARATAELAGIFVMPHGHWHPAMAGEVYLKARRRDDNNKWYDISWGKVARLIRRTRELLATATEQEYRDAVEALAAHREDRGLPALCVSYLVPTRVDWVDELIAAWQPDSHYAELLWCSVSSAEQAAALWKLAPDDFRGAVHTVVDGVGPALTPLVVALADISVWDEAGSAEVGTVFADLFSGAPVDTPERHQPIAPEITAVLAALPFDAAFQALANRLPEPHVHSAVIEAMGRFPVRALRLLATAASGTLESAPFAARLLHGQVRTHPTLVDAVAPGLTEAARKTLDQAVRGALVGEASTEELPRLMVEPLWTRQATFPAKPVTIDGLAAPHQERVVWAPGEQQQWATAGPDEARQRPDWDRLVRSFNEGELSREEAVALFTEGPEDLVRALLADSDVVRKCPALPSAVAPRLVARFELAALPLALAWGEDSPYYYSRLLIPLFSPRVAKLMLRWLVRSPEQRGVVRAWLRRHPSAAARALVPLAVGTESKPRRHASTALRLLMSCGHREEVIGAAGDYGDEVLRAIEAMPSDLDLAPNKIPAIPSKLDLYLLPMVLLRGTNRAVPVSVTGHIVTMLALSTPDEVYAGISLVKQTCDPASLDEFVWGIFEQLRSGPDANTALRWLGWLGGDQTVRRLSPLIRTWPGEQGHHKAVVGLDVLLTIGTELALVHLGGIAQKVRYKGVKAQAQQRLGALATELGLTEEQLADRLVPHFGLDREGALTLDYGTRQFHAGFDEQLKPFVTDATGKRLRTLPKPGVRDDQEVAAATYKRFAGLKKDVRTVAADQLQRFELAMVEGRRWVADEFRTYLVEHPLLWHITRRLVWFSEEGTAFRLAEDRTLADVRDEALTLAPSAKVGLAHPLHLGAELGAWAEILADYQILQPFPQLGRPVFTLTDEERSSDEVHRFQGSTVPIHRVIGLERRGWQRGSVEDNGIQHRILRPLSGLHSSVVVELDPGIAMGNPQVTPEQTIKAVWTSCAPYGNRGQGTDSPRFGDLDPVSVSEVLADLTQLITPTS